MTRYERLNRRWSFRNKQIDDHACSRRDATNSNRHNLGIMSAPRKPPRLAESALSSGESTTGDSSQQSQNSQRSQRSVVYLHAATGTIDLYIREYFSFSPDDRRFYFLKLKFIVRETGNSIIKSSKSSSIQFSH